MYLSFRELLYNIMLNLLFAFPITGTRRLHSEFRLHTSSSTFNKQQATTRTVPVVTTDFSKTMTDIPGQHGQLIVVDRVQSCETHPDFELIFHLQYCRSIRRASSESYLTTQIRRRMPSTRLRLFVGPKLFFQRHFVLFLTMV
jgi:hypothetical protein